MREGPGRVRQEIEVLARTGLSTSTFFTAALDALARAVPFEQACLAPSDPATGLMTGGQKWGGGDDEHDAAWVYHEYEGPDPFNFAVVDRRPSGVGTAKVETGGDLSSSPRFTELYHVWDFGDEARIALQADATTWGFLALFREGSRAAFTGAEQEYLSGVRAALAVGLRTGMLTAVASAAVQVPDGPVVLVVDGADEVVRASVGAAEAWSSLTGQAIGAAAMPFSVRTLVAAARRFGRGDRSSVPRARLHSPGGPWFVAHASPLVGRDGAGAEVVVTLEEARPPEIVPLVVAALGLTGRERDVVALTMQGLSTSEMARSLNLSAWTVQDHLKTIFDKAGVRSRRELLARVFYDQYAPRIATGTPVDPSGWFSA